MTTVAKYSTHARTLEELRTEFIGDIHRRLDVLDRATQFASSSTEKSRIAYAKREFEYMIKFWTDVRLANSRTAPAQPHANSETQP